MSVQNVPEKYLNMTVREVMLHEEKIVRLMMEYTVQEMMKVEEEEKKKK